MFSIESRVRSYCRSFPTEFTEASGAIIKNTEGKSYIDFLSGCGSLNYGHNHPYLQQQLLDYIGCSGISMSLDMETKSKREFLEKFYSYILKPRNMDYRLQFPGPTGANAVEAAIKLARKVTGRTNVIAFTNAFHGCSLGALALTGSYHHRSSSSSLLNQVSRFAYDGYFGPDADTADLLERMLSDKSGGIDKPAAIILEAIQGEGGLNVASGVWVKKIVRIAQDHGALLIVDDIQAGCGRSGPFFSFERFGIQPDIVLLAKSLSGYGLPMSLLMMKPEFDAWLPGEHNGTFRGNNLAFVTAAAALDAFWKDDVLEKDAGRKAQIVRSALSEIVRKHAFTRKGEGMMQGLEVGTEALSAEIRSLCFKSGLIIEGCGPTDSVVKLMPPLNIDDDILSTGLEIISQSFETALSKRYAAQHSRKIREEEAIL